MVTKIALASLLFLSACQSTGGSFCAIENPIRPTQAEIAVMGDATVAAILAHNLTGKKLCGWSAVNGN
jgi:hypothetical protein